jgi:hypothetical protein
MDNDGQSSGLRLPQGQMAILFLGVARVKEDHRRNTRSTPETFLKAVEPFREDLVVAVAVAVEYILNWY